MKHSYMDRVHPAICFFYFAAAMVMSVIVEHPVYLLASVIGALLFNISITGIKALRKLFWYLPVALAVMLINPIFNTLGETVLFWYWGRPYTLEALTYGGIVGSMLLGMLLWFSAYNAVMTEDKFFYLFATLSPSMALLLTTVLRMIPNLMRKIQMILRARKCVGMGAGERAPVKKKLSVGVTAISVLASWALEGGVVTADSMNSRGYGLSKRSSFQAYRFTWSDLLLALILIFAWITAFVALLGGGASAQFIPFIKVAPVEPLGLWAYLIFILTPTILCWKEEILWRVSISGI